MNLISKKRIKKWKKWNMVAWLFTVYSMLATVRWLFDNLLTLVKWYFRMNKRSNRRENFLPSNLDSLYRSYFCFVSLFILISKGYARKAHTHTMGCSGSLQNWHMKRVMWIVAAATLTAIIILLHSPKCIEHGI